MKRLLMLAAACVASGALAQAPAAPAKFEGTLVALSGTAEMLVANDEAIANFFAEVQEADAARAQSQVNRRTADGVAAIKRADPKATVETSGYHSYPVYEPRTAQKIIGWRVRQNVAVRTSNLEDLAKTVQAGQQQMALSGIEFRLSRAAREKVEGELIQRAIANLNSRVAAAAAALGVPRERQRIEELNFNASSSGRPPVVAARMAASPVAESVAEPQLDAGQSSQQVTVAARVRFLQ